MIESELIKYASGYILLFTVIYILFCVIKSIIKDEKYEKDKTQELINKKEALYSLKMPKLINLLNKLDNKYMKHSLPHICKIYYNSNIKKLSIEQRDDGYFVKVLDDGTSKNGEKK